MSDVVFARTRYEYGSYIDLHLLVIHSGFPITFVDEMELDDKDKIYITAPMNGELLYIHENSEEYRNRKCQVIQWNLERPSGSGSILDYVQGTKAKIDAGIIDRVIIGDKMLGIHTGFQYVPVGGCASLGGLKQEKSYDITFLSAYSNRRSFLFRVPGEYHNELFGAKVMDHQQAEDPLRNDNLLKTKFMFNTHQDEGMYMEPLRWMIAANVGMPIITESVFDAFPYIEWSDFIQADLHEMGTILIRALNEPWELWYERGKALREKMTTEFSFRNCLEKYL